MLKRLNRLKQPLFLVVVGLLSAFLIWLFASLLMPRPIQVLDQPSTPTGEQYLISTVDGKIAVFVPPYDNPKTIHPIYVNTLPILDQNRLAQGIYVEDLETVNRYLADFES